MTQCFTVEYLLSFVAVCVALVSVFPTIVDRRRTEVNYLHRLARGSLTDGDGILQKPLTPPSSEIKIRVSNGLRRFQGEWRDTGDTTMAVGLVKETCQSWLLHAVVYVHDIQVRLLDITS